MTTITFDDNLDLEKSHFKNLEELRMYLFEQKKWLPVEDNSFYDELERRSEMIDTGKTELKTWEEVQVGYN